MGLGLKKDVSAKIASRAMIFVFLCLFASMFIFPLLWILSTSFKPVKEIYRIPLTLIPHKFTLTHYQHIFTDLPDFFVYFKNSVVVTTITLVLIIALSSLAGYAFGRRDFVGKNLLFAFTLIAFDIPYAIYLIPIYIMEDTLGLINTTWGLIFPYTALHLSLGIFIMRGNFRIIPSELEDAARIDGCNPFQIWFKIMLPLVVPGLITVAVISFAGVWEEFMFARTLTFSKASQTLPVGIPILKEEAQSWAYGSLSAVLVLSFIPVILVFLITQKYFVRGLLKGSLKG
ncbi:Trehalose transport system permease protein SugB [subsurface metagenome]